MKLHHRCLTISIRFDLHDNLAKKCMLTFDFLHIPFRYPLILYTFLTPSLISVRDAQWMPPRCPETF